MLEAEKQPLAAEEAERRAVQRSYRKIKMGLANINGRLHTLQR
jgi:hypothetical protein